MGGSRRHRRETKRRAGLTPRAAPPTGRAAQVHRSGGELWIGLGIFLAALAVRLAYLWESSDNPTFLSPIVDSGKYDSLARGLAEQGIMGVEFFWQPFFYPFILSALYAISHSSMVFAKVFQAALGALTCLLTYRLGRSVFDRPTGVVAGLITALYGPLIFFEGELVAAGWAAFWSVVLIALTLRAAAKRTVPACLLLGVCCGLACVTRPTFLPFMAAACLWLVVVFVRGWQGWGHLVGRLAMLVAGFGLVALPVALQYRQVVGRLGLLPISGGLNLFLGNNADVCATVTIRPGTSAWMDLIGQSGLEDVEDMVGRSRSLGNEVKEFAAGEPLAFARGLGSKAVRFVAGRELPRNIDIYAFREWSVLLRVLVWKAGRFGFPWGILLPLAVAGLVFRWRQVPLPVVLFMVLYPLSVIAVFVSARYRVPLVPVMSVLAAAGCLHLVTLWRGRRVARAATAWGVAVATAVLVSLPRPFCEEQIDYAGEMYVWLGDDEREAGRLDQARLRYDQALRSDRDSALAHVRMGHLMVTTGDLDEATAHLSAALEQGADYVAYYYRGYAYLKAADFDRALGDFDAAIGIKPRFAPAYLARGDAYYGRGDNVQARRDWEHVLGITEYTEAIEKAKARLQALEEVRP